MKYATFAGAALNGVNLLTDIALDRPAWAALSLLGLLMCSWSLYWSLSQ